MLLLVLRKLPGAGFTAEFSVYVLCLEFNSAVRTKFPVDYLACILAEEFFRIIYYSNIRSLFLCMHPVQFCTLMRTKLCILLFGSKLFSTGRTDLVVHQSRKIRSAIFLKFRWNLILELLCLLQAVTAAVSVLVPDGMKLSTTDFAMSFVCHNLVV